ncbi:MAG: Rrf2 family transcriptional regulator, partial [Mailhella sp.]|nr:Rrf2 family transcriptional regulator [Mailhella sp.]
MKFFTKSRYALRVMIELARHPREQSIPLKYLAEKQNISLKYLEQIIVPLSRAGLVRSERGSQGGYMLAVDADQCTAGQVLRAIEGSLAPVECLDPAGKTCDFRT